MAFDDQLIKRIAIIFQGRNWPGHKRKPFRKNVTVNRALLVLEINET